METNSDKERIEKEAERWVSCEYGSGQDEMQSCFIVGARYGQSIANQQLAEKDKEFELFKKNTAFREQLSIENRDKRDSEIEVLKEALRKAQVILRNEDTQKYYTTTLDEEIEQLLK